jgi:hypothetical protein
MRALDTAGTQSKISSCMGFMASGAARDAYRRLLTASTVGESKGEQRKSPFSKTTKEG